MKKLALAQELKENAYPGRGIVIGRSKDGRKRSLHTLSWDAVRIAVIVSLQKKEGIRTQAFDPAKLEDPSLIIYAPVRVLGDETIVTNGIRQTQYMKEEKRDLPLKNL